MSLDDFVVYTKTYDVMNWLFPLTMKFPKSQRFVLGQRIENTILSLLELIVEANSVTRRVPLIRRALVKLQLLHVLIRFSKDQRFISLKQYELGSRQLDEIGRLLGGWLRSQKRDS